MGVVAVCGKPGIDVEPIRAVRDDVEDRGCSDRASELRTDIEDRVLCGETTTGDLADRHRRVEVATGDMTDGVRHREDGEAERE